MIQIETKRNGCRWVSDRGVGDWVTTVIEALKDAESEIQRWISSDWAADRLYAQKLANALEKLRVELTCR